MKLLFVIAMEKEALSIIEKYGLKRISENFYCKDDISLVITKVGRNAITSSLIDLILNKKYDIKKSTIINIGFVGSNKLNVGSVVMVNKSFGYHFDETPFGEELYHSSF